MGAGSQVSWLSSSSHNPPNVNAYPKLHIRLGLPMSAANVRAGHLLADKFRVLTSCVWEIKRCTPIEGCTRDAKRRSSVRRFTTCAATHARAHTRAVGAPRPAWRRAVLWQVRWRSHAHAFASDSGRGGCSCRSHGPASLRSRTGYCASQYQNGFMQYPIDFVGAFACALSPSSKTLPGLRAALVRAARLAFLHIHA